MLIELRNLTFSPLSTEARKAPECRADCPLVYITGLMAFDFFDTFFFVVSCSGSVSSASPSSSSGPLGGTCSNSASVKTLPRPFSTSIESFRLVFHPETIATFPLPLRGGRLLRVLHKTKRSDHSLVLSFKKYSTSTILHSSTMKSFELPVKITSTLLIHLRVSASAGGIDLTAFSSRIFMPRRWRARQYPFNNGSSQCFLQSL